MRCLSILFLNGRQVHNHYISVHAIFQHTQYDDTECQRINAAFGVLVFTVHTGLRPIKIVRRSIQLMFTTCELERKKAPRTSDLHLFSHHGIYHVESMLNSNSHNINLKADNKETIFCRKARFDRSAEG